jgi:hypothetical protein
MPKFKNKSLPAQTTLEFTLCFIVIIIIFLAGFLIFKWSMENLTRRQMSYEAGQDYATPPLNLHVGGDPNAPPPTTTCTCRAGCCKTDSDCSGRGGATICGRLGCCVAPGCPGGSCRNVSNCPSGCHTCASQGRNNPIGLCQ